MQEISLIVKKMLKGKENKEKYYLAYLQVHWRDLVGEKIAQKSQPYVFKNNILFLNTTSSAWANNLLILKNDIINKINSILNAIIKDIKISVIAKLDTYQPEIIQEETIFLQELSSLEREKIQEKLIDIKDDDLYKKLFNVIAKDVQRKKYSIKEGFEKCSLCGVQLTQKEKMCFVCAQQQKQNLNMLVRQKLFEVPFICFEQIKEEVLISKEDFLKIKKECLLILLNKIQNKDPSKNDIRSYVMMKNNCDINSLTNELIESTIKKIRGKNSVSSFRT